MQKKTTKILRESGFHIEPEKALVFDVVCGMEFFPETAEFISSHNGEAYYFCSQVCKDHFDGNPEKYAG